MRRKHGLLKDKNAKVRGEFVEHVSRAEVYKRHGGRCGICGGKLSPRNWEVDHRIPASKGGEHSYENCQPSHPYCNRMKADLMPWELEERGPLPQPVVHSRKKRRQKYRNNRKPLKRPAWPGP